MIFAMKVTDIISRYGIKYFEKKISKKKFDRVIRMGNINRANGMLMGELMIRKLISDTFNIKTSEIEINTDDFGKPYLKNILDLKFNISYSTGWVVCVIDNEEIGIDIEYIYPLEPHYLSNMLSDIERRYIEEKPNSIDRLFKIWTLKECYLKALGIGLSVPLHELTFNKVDKKWNLESNLFDYDTNFKFKQISFDENYVVSLCTKKEHFNTHVKLMEHSNII
ncbi:4'-phosphopantetheinyl transferase superfamily protein [Alkalihalophilus lindianensis]|uniref:4'-phosphopantetheinyl transferase superfamily protein n=1 Tax=Alkalihalophilus lindianensis TaxID=1630542 RepID=A0ABU3XBE1_9BACI|nr:4'-phosphopantetheinyl transferase superfamily protein [Alkalihalophilus lindianensis]MDV2685200.1 4'-phosphopantetheinyl transferase superfamily protein [Alkalihalophilus lindianensis]